MAVELKRVLISDEVDKLCIDVLEKNGIEAVKKTKLSKEELKEEIKNYDGLIVRSATKVTEEIINSGNRLKIVGRAGTGVDNVQIPAATKKGVIVMNTPGGNTISAAEHTCALISSLARNVPAGDASMKAGKWARKDFMGSELSGKTLAIIGLGQIGKQVAIRMQSFGMRTIGFDVFVNKEQAQQFGIERLELEELWPLADYITVHVPLIPPTKHMINEKTLALCKPTVRILNVARGGIVDEAALLKGLNAGTVAGAALDVFETEPPKGVSLELAQHKNVIATPHLGASTIEAQTRVAVEIAQQFVDFTSGKSLFGAINAGALANALDPRCKPLIQLAKALGGLGCKLASADKASGSGETKLKIVGCGESLKKANFLLNAALVGVLHAATPNGFNLINAPEYAKEKAIKAEFVHEDALPVTKLAGVEAAVKLCIEGQGRTWELVGTTTAAGPMLLSIDGIEFPFGCPLNGPQTVLVKGTAAALPQMMTAITAKNISVCSLVTSSAMKDGSMWAVCNVSGGLEADKDLQGFSIATSIEI